MYMRVLFGLLLLGLPLCAQEPVRMRERLEIGLLYQVRSRVELNGTLTAPPMNKEDKPKKLTIRGHSSIDYEERLLSLNREGEVEKTIRDYSKVTLERTVGGVDQSSTLREPVRRVVLLRRENKEMPFSPDGPLTFSEIDLIRTDVFTPALSALLPAGAVRVGQSWKVGETAVRELTDLERIESGEIVCQLEKLVTADRQRQAKITFKGTVRGTNEDGPNQQEIDGLFYFNLEAGHLSYLSLRGTHLLLDGDGKEMGRIEGRFVVDRRRIQESQRLSEADLRRLTLEPNDENTLLLYENADLGLRFQHSRRWRVSGVQGSQVTLDTPDGSGLVISIDTLGKLPDAARFLRESQEWLRGQKAQSKLLGRPVSVQRRPTAVDHFQVEVELNRQQFLMDYYVVRDVSKGMTLAARLVGPDRKTLEQEVAGIARSARIK